MCIIILKPLGKAMPSEEILNNCWDNNSDGAGFYIKKHDRIRYRKGFMTFEALKDALNRISNPERKEIGIHFRVATHGSISQGMTHPFPITDKQSDMVKLWGSGAVVMHNGIIDVDIIGDMSDTASWVCSYLSANMKKPAAIEQRTIGSRFLIATTKAETMMIGESWEYDDKSGCWFSNSGWSYRYKPAIRFTSQHYDEYTALYDITDYIISADNYMLTTTTFYTNSWYELFVNDNITGRFVDITEDFLNNEVVIKDFRLVDCEVVYVDNDILYPIDEETFDEEIFNEETFRSYYDY